MDSCQSNPACPGRQLSYKTSQHCGLFFFSYCWYPSSQIHHGCMAPDGTPCRPVGKHRIDKHHSARRPVKSSNRDVNAALNLRDWPDHACCGPAGATTPSVPGPIPSVGTGHGGGRRIIRCRRSPRKSPPAGPEAERLEPKPRKGTLHERVTQTHSTATEAGAAVWVSGRQSSGIQMGPSQNPQPW